jgi:uncharacterized repeat protein (TIGR01451 family)
MKKTFLTLFVLLFLNSLWGQSWVTTIRDTVLILGSVSETTDSNYLIVAIKNVDDTQLLLLDKNGKIKWRKTYKKEEVGGFKFTTEAVKTVTQCPDGGYILNISNDFGEGTGFYTKIDANGEIVWSKQGKSRPTNPAVLPNNDVVFAQKTFKDPTNGKDYWDITLVKGSNGEVLSGKGLPELPVGILSDSRFIYVLTEKDFMRFNHNLTFFDSKPLVYNAVVANPNAANKGFFRFIRLSDGNFAYLRGSYETDVVKLDSTGQFLWKAQCDNSTFIIPANNGLIYFKDNRNNFNVSKIDLNGKVGWSKIYTSNGSIINKFALANKKGDIILALTLQEKNNVAGLPYVDIIKLSQWDINPESHISGKVFRKNSCQDATSSNVLSGITVKADNGKGTEFWATTDTLGRYTILCDTGSYKVNVVKQSELWQVCQNDFTVKAGDTLNFSINAASLCPALTTDISTPFLRRCFENTYYVKYCNNGTLLAPNAFVEVTLDSLLEYRSASRTLSRRDGRKLYFNVGDVGINECGSFNVTVYVKCGDSTRLNQTLCVKSHIFPDTLCKKPIDWSGASLTVSGVCERDSVRFLIKNEGNAPSSILKSVVIEDHVMFLRSPVQLGVGASKTIKVPSNGSTWRMSVQQEPNHPTSIAPTAFVEGCRSNTTQPLRMGFVTAFDEDDATPSVDADCQVIIGAFDPNDKIGYPTGYGKDNFIDQNQDIEYLIRFQNTGTDTAFNIVVLDTLPSQLEFANIQFGASSHKYAAELQGKGILKFSFNNINLADSFKNEAKSHGFLKFTIQQKKDVALGAKIRNNAAIYFDFNAPIFTNTTLHTIGKPILAAIFDKAILPSGSIKMYPNPMRESAVFEIKDYPLSIKAKFHLFDALGRTLRVESFIGERLDFQRNGLEKGIYFFKIEDDEQLLGSGKLIVQ